MTALCWWWEPIVTWYMVGIIHHTIIIYSGAHLCQCAKVETLYLSHTYVDVQNFSYSWHKHWDNAGTSALLSTLSLPKLLPYSCKVLSVDVTTPLNSVKHNELSYEVEVVVPEPQLMDDSLIGCVTAPDRADNKCIGLRTVPRLNVVLGKLGMLSVLIVAFLPERQNIYFWMA